jgi:plasmid stabilization system protein ParE
LRIVYSLDAERDLVELFDYIAQDGGLQRAELVLRRIERTVNTLADWPLIGRIRPELDGAPRSFSVWPWIVIYEPQPNGRGIYVWRVLDGRRDLPRVVRNTKR